MSIAPHRGICMYCGHDHDVPQPWPVPITEPKPETRSVCPACGHIEGAHLKHCRIATLESSLAFKSAQVDRIVIEEAAATKAAKERAKKAEDALAAAEEAAIRRCAAVCAKHEQEWGDSAGENTDQWPDAAWALETAILALIPPKAEAAKFGLAERYPATVTAAEGAAEVKARPIRVQLSRRKGWRMPPDTVKVDRTTAFGNPFTVQTCTEIRAGVKRKMYVCGESFNALFAEKPLALAVSVKAFRSHIEHPANRKLLDTVRAGLRGKNLACWCKLDAPCHADVLLDLANKP